MTTFEDKPLALEAYEALADRYAAVVDTKAIYVHYERPAMLSLLPDVNGKRVLDAGCGPGSYAEWLVSHGAQVIALDISARMVQIARQRLGPAVEVRRADLAKPLDFLPDGYFDLIVCALVLHYLQDWENVFREFYRILRPSGQFVFSVHHPMDYIKFKSDNYFITELVREEWRGFGRPVQMRFYRRPLSAMIQPLTTAGFLIEQLLEPQPTAAYRKENAAEYELLSKTPRRLCIRAVKR